MANDFGEWMNKQANSIEDNSTVKSAAQTEEEIIKEFREKAFKYAFYTNGHPYKHSDVMNILNDYMEYLAGIDLMKSYKITELELFELDFKERILNWYKKFEEYIKTGDIDV
jgi:hypothetical protein